LRADRARRGAAHDATPRATVHLLGLTDAEFCPEPYWLLGHCRSAENAQEQRPLVAEDGIRARPAHAHAHAGEEIVTPSKPFDQNTWVAFSSASSSSKPRGRPRDLVVL